MTIVAAFDPGGTTGFALAAVTFGEGMPRFSFIEACEIKTYRTFHTIIDVGLLASNNKPDVFIIEQFNLFPHQQVNQVGSTFPSAEWIGIIQYVLWTAKLDDRIVMQTPAQKERIDNDMLRKLFSVAHLVNSEHVRDAMRHITFWGLDRRYG